MNSSTIQPQSEPSTIQREEAVPPLKVHHKTPAETAPSTLMLCCYQNRNSMIQVVRSNAVNSPDWHLERVVFPGQRLLFHAPQQTDLQVYTADIAGNLLTDTIPCDRLRVADA